VTVRCTANGYVLLMMLLVLLGAGGGLLSFSAQMHGHVQVDLQDIDAQRLVDARQSLLSYSVLYHYLYGPAGAGPGHLPCPDTDGYAQAAHTLESGFIQRLDGANPPCASADEPDGYLPRHTVLPGIRYLFHSEPWQRYEYRVAAQIINNPVNRTVNLATLDQSGHRSLAVVSIPSLNGDFVQGQVTLRGNSLRHGMASSVAAWVLARSNQTVRFDMPLRCESDRLLTMIFDQPVTLSGTACLTDSPGENTIEGVPVARHWYFRNRWHEWVRVVNEQGCETGALSAEKCRLVLPKDSRNGVNKTDSEIVLYRVRSS